MNRIVTLEDLENTIDEIGLLPFWGDGKETLFTLGQLTDNDWFTGLEESDPWEWRRIVATRGKQAYGKFFMKKAGFVSRDAIPAFIAARRDNRSFSELYYDGLISRAAKQVWDCFENQVEWTHQDLKRASGFGRDSKGFEAATLELQGLFFLCIPSQSRRVNKMGEPYGWECNDFGRMDVLFPVEEDDCMEKEEGEQYLLDCIRSVGDFDEKKALRLIRAGGV